jgi:dTDP-4-dehydrorhamnose reductase
VVLLLGASGFLAGAFATEMRRRSIPFRGLSRRERDYTQFNVLFDYVRRERPEFIINAAGLPGTPNVDACESSREQVLHANMVLPQQVAQISRLTNTPWAHVSSGSIFCGARVRNGSESEERVERDSPASDLARKQKEQPGSVHGFSETDEPNFSFLNPPCNFYSGTKALGEEAIGRSDLCYILRPGLPFASNDHPRNLLSKLQRYPKVLNQLISGSHINDFSSACLDLWIQKAPFGVYHVANPGFISTGEIVEKMRKGLGLKCSFQEFKDEAEYYETAGKEPRSNSLLDCSKLVACGIQMRPIQDAIDAAIREWRPSLSSLKALLKVEGAGD